MSAIPEGVTLGIAITGAVLGILNTWRNFDRDKIKLRVTPRLFISSTGESGLCLEVVNLSYLPVTLASVGFTLHNPVGHFFAFAPQFMDDSRLPLRMEARSSVTVFMPDGAHLDPQLAEAGRAFAKTACDRTFYGSSQAFRSHLTKLRSTR